MKKDWSSIEKYRIQPKGMESKVGDRFGAFAIPLNPRYKVFCIVTAGESYPGIRDDVVGWEHVSAHGEERQCAGDYRFRTPSWNVMCQLKEIFWEDDETVVQYHVPKKDHVNTHGATLHLWRHATLAFPRPPQICV